MSVMGLQADIYILLKNDGGLAFKTHGHIIIYICSRWQTSLPGASRFSSG